MKPKLIAVILAGGQSSRMGKDKATLSFGAGRLIDHMVQLVATLPVSDIVVSGNISPYNCIVDSIPHCGPLGGVFSVMKEVEYGNTLFFIPVDMPLLSTELLSKLHSKLIHYDARCYQHFPLPFCIKNTQRTRSILEKTMQPKNESKCSVKAYLKQLSTHYLALSELYIEQMMNTNTPEQWQKVAY